MIDHLEVTLAKQLVTSSRIESFCWLFLFPECVETESTTSSDHLNFPTTLHKLICSSFASNNERPSSKGEKITQITHNNNNFKLT